MDEPRLHSVDFFRVTAIFAVICIHCRMFVGDQFGGAIHKVLRVGVFQGGRFAVPFFFIAAGYFYGRKIQSGSSHKELFNKYGKRLASIFLFWSLVFLLAPKKPSDISNYGLWIPYVNAHRLSLDPLNSIFQGTSIHLWFIVSLLLALLLLSTFLSLGLRKAIIPFAVGLYVLGLLGRSYSFTPLGFDTSFNTRNGPFFSTLFVVIGWFLSNTRFQKKSFSSPKKIFFIIIITLAGFVLHMTEAFVLWKFFDVNTGEHECLLGTLPWATGIMLILIIWKDLAKGAYVTKLGKYTLGIYVSHPLFVSLLRPWWNFSNFFLVIILPVIVYALSLSLIVLIAQHRFLKRFVI